MDSQRLTQKTQEALHDAQTKALRYGHTEVDPEHLLLALLEQPDGLVARLLDGAAGDADTLRTAVRQQLERRPRVSRPGRRRQSIGISRALGQVLDAALEIAERMKDEYVSVEHVLLAMAQAHQSSAGRLLADHGVTPRALARGADRGAG